MSENNNKDSHADLGETPRGFRMAQRIVDN